MAKNWSELQIIAPGKEGGDGFARLCEYCYYCCCCGEEEDETFSGNYERGSCGAKRLTMSCYLSGSIR
ncbi:predicted protein [Sclerotinia sclerotiorum 1980 UF-70]|uniref:Uncharacterized protein n=1 Tax=Sclerotinia sclerotiorum (strain ATCC 18683 / 1980 / Ss-1) TaxID=665079 RepID=A7EUI2_SCLS1|nr:predicted protein [Sclerotinia sclerotiorum 1980 UF-70]EDN93124.1 predicted protein [Sclerotinia sclerotiorum 1980 UF-70]